MVSRMANRSSLKRHLLSLLILSSLFISHFVQANTSLHLIVEKSVLKQGKVLRAEIFSVGKNNGFENIDLNPLKSSFSVIVQDDPELVTDQRWPTSQVQRLRLKLYPRTTGKVEIAAISLGDVRSKIQFVQVEEADYQGSKITFHSHLSKQKVWQRQQTIFWAEVVTTEKNASLSIDKNWHPLGFDVISLTQTTQFNHAQQSTTLGIGWIIFPLISGQHDLELPSINYRVSGGVRQRYYPPIQSIQVKPLPPYIPPTLPVGQISLNSTLQPSNFLALNAIAWWTLTLTSDDLKPIWLLALKPQLKTTPNLQILEAKNQKSISPDQQGVHGKVRLKLPIKPQIIGQISLPSINIDYFNPHTGKLERLQYEPPRIWVYQLYLVALVGLMVITFLIWATKNMMTYLINRYTYRKAYQQIQIDMEKTDNAHDLREQFNRIAKLNAWPNNLSLKQWGELWNMTHKTHISVELEQLSVCYYAKKSDLCFTKVKQQLIKVIALK